jgi:hypothetical protein
MASPIESSWIIGDTTVGLVWTLGSPDWLW